MRLDSKLFHPSLQAAIKGHSWDWNGASKRDPRAASDHATIWFREHGTGMVAYVVSAFAIFLATALAMKGLHVAKPVLGITLVFLLFGLLVGGIYGIVRTTERLSLAEFEALWPALDLSEVLRAYAETIGALYRSGRSPGEIQETLAVLNALLDEESRLAAARDRIVGRDVIGGALQLEAERDELRSKIERTHDAVARDAYAQSLTLLEERVEGLRSGAAGLERIEAHLALLRQAVLATRDAARRLDAAPTMTAPDFATDSLRSTVALARAQVQATEQALIEVRAI